MKKWILGLAMLGGMHTLTAQIDHSTPTAGKSWLAGGAQESYLSSPPLPLPALREADILWEKRIWRVIDTREKINFPFRHPAHSLFTALVAGIDSGQLTAYSPADDRFSEPLAPAAIWNRLNQTDTITIIDPITGAYQQQVVTNTFDPARILRWRIQEVWYFDTRHSTQQVRILGLAPLLETTGEEGTTVSYESPLFWINYAEARPWLAQYAVASSDNDHSRSSWEDLFAMRQFSAYVYKENDLLGRRLQDYRSGEDLLRKSKQIDRDLQHRKMDVWSY
ncbi:MAG: gliding motility protein GldN [Bacteroidetes bacterium]|nr:MAG: gliding motility protein GldN [Bacteroidota bacterium]PTM10152.1 MAG: gliding motility protein GldN [Bacteroidota bacterium]